MKSRPLLFSPVMASATLRAVDPKTQTRRIVNPQPPTWANDPQIAVGPWVHIYGNHPNGKCGHPKCACMQAGPAMWTAASPYGSPGDELWVREEHYRFGHWEPVEGVQTKGGKQKWRFVADSDECRFDAPDTFRKGRHHFDSATPAWHKRLARFMPRQLSRITLEIVSVRIERLQDISEADAWAEGIGDPKKPLCSLANLCIQFPKTNIGSLAADDPKLYRFGDDRSQATDYERVVSTSGRGVYAYLWESINGTGSWANNPFVWVVTFKRKEPA